NIPRHAFNLWLIIKHKLKTQDRVYVWDVSNTLGSTCSLCEATPDSHEHLFFMCPFSNDVWDHMKKLAGLDRVVHDVYAIIHHIGPKAKRRSSHIVIAKLVVAASAYFIWQERNWRLFKKTKRTVNQVIECIKSAVRLKLLSCSFKRSSEGVRYARMWDLPDTIFKSGNEFVYDPNPYSYDETPNFFNQPPHYQYETYSCEFCGGNSHPGYDYQTGNTPVVDQDPCYNQDFGFNQPLHYFLSQPQHFSTVQLLEIERINKEESFKKKDMSIEEIMSEKRLIDDEIKDITNDLSYKRFRGEKIDDEYERDCEIKINQLLQDYNGLDIEMRKKERVLIEEKYLAASQRIKSICNYDDDEDDSIPLRDIIARYSPSVAITSSPPVLPTREPEDSLIMGDEHLDTIPEKESDELIKSSVENLVPIPSESEDFSDNESECDETSPTFTTFSNPLFDSNDDFTSSDDESLSDEDVPMENFKIYSNPLFDDEEIISPKIDPHYFNAESNLIESLLNRDILIDSSPKFDYLLEEFSGELAHIDPIPSGIKKADFDLEEEIRLVENLLYDNSSPRPPEELNLEIADTILESLSPSSILVEDSDSDMEEIDLFLATNDSMPPGIEDDDYDSKGDIRFLEELLNNDSLHLPENESSNLDHFNDPSPSLPPPEPQDVKICCDFEPDTGIVTTKVVKGIFEHYVLMPNILPTGWLVD
ncbi:transposase, Ptta/En/Spm, transposase, Tnp1/En/Spm-like protein, partial [Tanacetum coccineum]